MKFLVLSLLSINVLMAECFILGDFKGVSAFAQSDFKLEDDGFGKREFIVNIDGDNSSVSNNNLSFLQVGKHSLIGLYDNNGKTTIETWFIYPLKNKATYTKTINGFGDLFNGTRMFVGNIKGRCNNN